MSTTSNDLATWLSIVDDANRFGGGDRLFWTFLAGGNVKPVQVYGYVSPDVVRYLKGAASEFLAFDDTWLEVKLLPKFCNNPLDFTSAFTTIRGNLNNQISLFSGKFPDAESEKIEKIPMICAPIRRLDSDRGFPRAGIPRDIAPLFGVIMPAVHLNIYSVSRKNVEIYIARHTSRSSYPLDQCVVGELRPGDDAIDRIRIEAFTQIESGIPLHKSPRENAEGCGLPWVRYFDLHHMSWGERAEVKALPKPGMLRPFDLELAPGTCLKPRGNSACTVEAFTIEQVKNALVARQFKPESGLVMLDFLVRHKLIGGSNEGRKELSDRLRRDLVFPCKDDKY